MEIKAKILLDLAREINNCTGGFEDIALVCDNLDDLIEISGKSGGEIARATFFGDIKSWEDDCFYIDVYGNFSSCSEMEFEKKILNCENEIIEEFLEIFKDNLKAFREELEELKVDIDNLD